MEQYKLFDAEYKFLNLIWDHEPVNSTELSKISFRELGWKKPTTYNMIRKLCERGILRNENATVSSIVKREQVQKFESKAIVEKTFSGSLPAFMAAFLDDRRISVKEAEELKRIIEEATK